MNDESRVPGWWVFAATLLAISSILNIVWGIAAISDSKFFTADSVFIVSDLHTWGWVTLIVGAIQLLAAFSLFAGGTFGRVIGVIAASLGALDALAGTGTTPFWSLAVFTLGIAIVFELVNPPGRSLDI